MYASGIATREIAPSVGPQPVDHPIRRWRVYEDVLPADMTGMRVLDLGSADGFFAIEMARPLLWAGALAIAGNPGAPAAAVRDVSAAYVACGDAADLARGRLLVGLADDGDRVVRQRGGALVALGELLVAEDAERHDRGGHLTRLAHDCAVRFEVGGIEVHRADGGSARVKQTLFDIRQPSTSSRHEHHFPARAYALGDLPSDIAARAKQQDGACTVTHRCRPACAGCG